MVDWDDSALIAQKPVAKRRYALRTSKVWHICKTCLTRIPEGAYCVVDTYTMDHYHNDDKCKPVEK